jgi:hypothetical protein
VGCGRTGIQYCLGNGRELKIAVAVARESDK